jgi:hypothetical protein
LGKKERSADFHFIKILERDGFCTYCRTLIEVIGIFLGITLCSIGEKEKNCG